MYNNNNNTMDDQFDIIRSSLQETKVDSDQFIMNIKM